MTTDHPIDELVHRLTPRLTEPGGSAGPDGPAAQALRARIVATPRTETASASATASAATPAVTPARRVRPVRRGALVGVGIAAAVAGAVVATGALSPSSTPTGPAPAAADVLDITTEGDLVVARVSDPDADPERYAAEFAEHGLDVDLRLVPASPTVVGTVVYLDDNADGTGTDERPVETIEAPGACLPGGGGGCPVGIRIPANYTNRIDVVFGRQAEPGESYDSSTDAFAPGEALEGLELEGLTVGEVKDVIAERDQVLAEYRYMPAGSSSTESPDADEVPDDWYVYDVSLSGPGEVLAFVGPTADEPAPTPSENDPVTVPIPDE